MTAYTLHSQGSYGLASAGSSSGFTFGVQFAVSETVTLTGIWFYSPSGATGLPSSCALYDLDTNTQVPGTLNSSPSWSGTAGSGWVKCSYSSPSLSSGIHYAAVVFYGGGNNWWPLVSGYWTTGGGSGGITNGPLSAPPNSGAIYVQAPYAANGAAMQVPNTTSSSGFDWGVDVEVSTGSTNVSASFGLAMAPLAESFTADSSIRASFGLAMAPLKESFTAVEIVAGGFGMAMAPLKESFTAHESGANISASFGLAMTPLAMRFSQRSPGGLAMPDYDEARAFKRWLLWDL